MIFGLEYEVSQDSRMNFLHGSEGLIMGWVWKAASRVNEILCEYTKYFKNKEILSETNEILYESSK
jgi:hypothetical protein